jgi:hypothetical protein
MAEGVQERKRRGNEDFLGRGLPIGREELLGVLATCHSLRQASKALTKRLGLTINHNAIMDALRYDSVLKGLVVEAEQNYVAEWPKSATESYLSRWDWLHTLMQSRAKQILERDRWKGPWPSPLEICELFVETYSPDRWEGLTDRRNFLLASGMPKIYREALLVALSSYLNVTWNKQARAELLSAGWDGGWPSIPELGNMFVRAFSTKAERAEWQDASRRPAFFEKARIPERLWTGLDDELERALREPKGTEEEGEADPGEESSEEI